MPIGTTSAFNVTPWFKVILFHSRLQEPALVVNKFVNIAMNKKPYNKS